jgi:hypothetical protein
MGHKCDRTLRREAAQEEGEKSDFAVLTVL